jgi:hypothetical protein
MGICLARVEERGLYLMGFGVDDRLSTGGYSGRLSFAMALNGRIFGGDIWGEVAVSKLFWDPSFPADVLYFLHGGK